MFSPDGAIHFSSLKHIAKSPLHYAHAVAKTDYNTPSIRKGLALHGLVLTGQDPEVFDGDRRSAKWKEFVVERALTVVPMYDEDQRCTNSLSHVLTASEWDDVRWMRDAVLSNPLSRAILDQCTEREVPIEWQRNGFRCRGKIDGRSTSGRILMDIKSCKDASKWRFLRDAHRMAYHCQLPWYDHGQGVEVCGPDTNWSDQYLIAVENAAPFAVQVYKLDTLRIDQGWQETERWMERFAECVQKDDFRDPYSREVITWDADIIVSDDEEDDED